MSCQAHCCGSFALLGGFVLAVCSCTIMPLFASIYKKGSGLGPAMVIGDLVKFVGLAPSKEGLMGALREAGLV